MVPYATLDDAKARYEGTIATEREPWVATLLAEAEAKLDAKLPDLRGRVDAGTIPADLVRWTVVDAVLRVVRNPRGDRQELLGAYNVTRQMPSTTPARVEFTDGELAELGDVTDPATIVGSASLSLPAWRMP